MRRRWDSARLFGLEHGSSAVQRLRSAGLLTLATTAMFVLACGGRAEQTDNRGGELYLGGQSDDGLGQPGAMQAAPQGGTDGSRQDTPTTSTIASNGVAADSADTNSDDLTPAAEPAMLLSDPGTDERELERSETLEISGLELIDELGNCRLWLDSASSGLEPDDVTVTFEDEAWPAANPCIDQASWGLLRNTDGTFLDLCPAGCQVVQANPEGVLVVEALYWTDPGVRLAR